MSVNPGFGGQGFIGSALPKLREVRRRIDAHVAAGGQPIWLEIDGGVKVDNIGEIAAAGADTFVAGSAVFGAPDPDGGYAASSSGCAARPRGARAGERAAVEDARARGRHRPRRHAARTPWPTSPRRST